jgi:2-enoate reductase
VTLYEKSDKLGGLLQHTDFTKWKWAYKDFKDYLIRQVNKAGIEVYLNTTATPSMIKAKGYDTVLVATGAVPIIPRITGADGKNIYNIIDVYSNEKFLGENVVIIGAGRIGTETGICLAKDGHKVTILASGKEMLEQEVIGPHNMMNQMDIYQNHPNISYFLEVTPKSISGGKATYVDAEGNENSIQADSVVIYAGFKPRMDEAMKFLGSGGQVFLLGDCTGKNGNIQKAIRSAFFVASQV